MSGMTRTRLSDLGVWLGLSQQRAVPGPVECVCPANSATPENLKGGEGGVFGHPGLSL